MVNTPTMNQIWLPFFCGVIVGDFVASGRTIVIGCFTGISAYRINW